MRIYPFLVFLNLILIKNTNMNFSNADVSEISVIIAREKVDDIEH